MLLALPCGKDASDVLTQTNALQANLINYLLQKQAAGIINIQGPQTRVRFRWCTLSYTMH